MSEESVYISQASEPKRIRIDPNALNTIEPSKSESKNNKKNENIVDNILLYVIHIWEL